MNLTYVLGQHQCTLDEVILDFDFSGAYSAALGAIPAIDWERLDRVNDQRDQLIPTTVDDIVPRYQHLTALGYVPPIFGTVMVPFPPECHHPGVPVRSAKGLYDPLRALTSATGLELVQARTLGAARGLRQGQACPSPRAPETGSPVLVFAASLGDGHQRQQPSPPRPLGNRLYKEMAKSRYGQLAQGMQGRQPRTGFARHAPGRPAQEPLPASAIPWPPSAALGTGMVRAARSALVAGLDALPDVEGLRAPTDGGRVQAPRRFALAMLQQEEGVRSPDHLQPWERCPARAALETNPAVPALPGGRQPLGCAPHGWMAIKHGGDAAAMLLT
jgi:hypothetical protein